MQMKKRFPILLATLGVMTAGSAWAKYNVPVNLIDDKGVGAAVGNILIVEDNAGGVTLTPALKGLPPGPHGFHVHEKPDCGAKEKDGKMEPGEAAGPHYDPNKTASHQGPHGAGHLGDLPVLVVDAKGEATAAMKAPRLKIADLVGRSLMIHAGADNNADQPKPNGGGGTRIACGVIK
jgi:Cu-Zn family superoxide dismutase